MSQPDSLWVNLSFDKSKWLSVKQHQSLCLLVKLIHYELTLSYSLLSEPNSSLWVILIPFELILINIWVDLDQLKFISPCVCFSQTDLLCMSRLWSVYEFIWLLMNYTDSLWVDLIPSDPFWNNPGILCESSCIPLSWPESLKEITDL